MLGERFGVAGVGGVEVARERGQRERVRRRAITRNA
jgi:hypothetical protein